MRGKKEPGVRSSTSLRLSVQAMWECTNLYRAKYKAYWRKLKKRLKEEGNEPVTNCNRLKLRAADERS
jgi:hypothetical protein